MDIQKLPGAELRTYKRGTVLIHQGDPVTHLYYLVCGTIFREIVTPDGYEIVPSVKTAAAEGIPSLVGVLSLFTGNENYASNNTFITRTDCTCYKVPQTAVMEYLRQNPTELFDVVTLAMKELTNMFQLVVMRNEGQVANRLCKILMDRAVLKKDRYVVSGPSANVELAKFLGVHKVTIARIFRQLKAEGLVEKRGSVICILEPERVREYADCRRQLKYD